MRVLKRVWKPITAIAGLFIGNRLFNHVDAWLGVMGLTVTIIFIIYSLIKFIKNETSI